MTQNLVLQLDGIQGECTDADHKGWMDLSSFSHELIRPSAPGRVSAGGGTVERAVAADLLISKSIDSASDDIIRACWAGRIIEKGRIQAYRSNRESDAPELYLQIDLDMVVVSKYSLLGDAGETPQENIALSYGRIAYSYYPQGQGAKKQVSIDLLSDSVS